MRGYLPKKYNSRCALCGATAKDSFLQIDHMDEDPNNNVIDNLQVLCSSCNKGKSVLAGKVFGTMVSGRG